MAGVQIEASLRGWSWEQSGKYTVAETRKNRTRCRSSWAVFIGNPNVSLLPRIWFPVVPRYTDKSGGWYILPTVLRTSFKSVLSITPRHHAFNVHNRWNWKQDIYTQGAISGSYPCDSRLMVNIENHRRGENHEIGTSWCVCNATMATIAAIDDGWHFWTQHAFLLMINSRGIVLLSKSAMGCCWHSSPLSLCKKKVIWGQCHLYRTRYILSFNGFRFQGVVGASPWS